MIMLTVATAAVDSGGDGVAILGPTRLPAVPQLLSPLREDHAAGATCVREIGGFRGGLPLLAPHRSATPMWQGCGPLAPKLDWRGAYHVAMVRAHSRHKGSRSCVHGAQTSV